MRTVEQVERYESISNALLGILGAAAAPDAPTEPVDYSDWTQRRLKAHAVARGVDLFRRQKYKDDIIKALLDADAALANVDPAALTAAIRVGHYVMDGMTLQAAQARASRAAA